MPTVAAKQSRPVQWVIGALTVAFKWWIIGPILLWFATKKGARWSRVLRYHPIVLVALALLVFGLWLDPLAPLGMMAGLYLGLGTVMIYQPEQYRQHIHPRIGGFFWALRYRHSFKSKLGNCGLFKSHEPKPQLLGAQRIGCTVKAMAWQSDGMKLDDWRTQASRIAPAFDAQDCKVRAVWKDGELQPKRVELELLTRNPFKRPVGVEFIDFHLDTYQLQEGDPVGPTRDGTPYLLDVATHLINISITGGGKSNAERTMVYASYRKVTAGLRENWICELKRGVEATPMAHCFARVEDGREGPDAVYQFWQDVRNVMWARLDEMTKQGVTEFMPTPGNPELDVYFDEMWILESVPYAGVRKAIYATISEILVQGRAPKVRIKAFTQKAKLEQFPLRDDFPETQLGRVKTRSQVAMAMDHEAYDRGARANELNPDQPGIYYADTEGAMTPIDFRFCRTTIHDMQRLPHCPPSVLWRPELVTPEAHLVGPPSLAEPARVNPARRPTRVHARRRGHGVEPTNEEIKEMEEVLR